MAESAPFDNSAHNQHLAELAELSTDMISRHSPDDWRFIYASPAIEHLLGYSVEEIIGTSAYQLYHPDDAEDFKRRAPSVSYDKGLYTHTYRFRRKDGSYTWLESTSRSIRHPDTGQLSEILVVSRDASRRVQAEQANRRLAQALEASSDLVIFANTDGLITYLNEAARQQLCSAHPDVTDSYLPDLFQLADTADNLQQALTIAQKQQRWHGETDLWNPALQRAFPVMLELICHRDAHQRIEYFSLLARDLSAQKAAEQAARDHQNEMSHATRLISMGELASGLAHELNQPLTAINNYAQGLQRLLQQQPETLQASFSQPLQRISNTALRCGSIIHRMMNFARKSEPERRPHSLAPIIEEILQFCQHRAQQHDVQLDCKQLSPYPIEVIADKTQLEQILLNLLINAIEACQLSEQQNTKQVWVSATVEDNDQVIIRVNDLGDGLPSENTDQLFEQFVSSKRDGLGLGLSISRSLVEAHGGQLWAENNSDGGACFCFTLTGHYQELPPL